MKLPSDCREIFQRARKSGALLRAITEHDHIAMFEVLWTKNAWFAKSCYLLNRYCDGETPAAIAQDTYGRLTGPQVETWLGLILEDLHREARKAETQTERLKLRHQANHTPPRRESQTYSIEYPTLLHLRDTDPNLYEELFR